MLALFTQAIRTRVALQLFRLSLGIGAWVLCVVPATAATVVLSATADFPVRDAGEAPYYAEQVTGALAIRASIVEYRDVFARAETVYSGDNGIFDISIVGLAELDGEAIYKLSVNSELIGTATNPTTNIDYLPISHDFSNVTVRNGDVLAVESLANSNGKIPEGSGFAFARGRWTEVRLTPAGETDAQPEKVSLIGNAASLSADVNPGDSVVIDFAALNEDTAGATATDVTVHFDVPEAFGFSESDNCTQSASAHPGSNTVICAVGELAPGNAVTGELHLVAIGELDNATIQATVLANETDIDGADNRADITLSISPAENLVTSPEPAEENPSETNPESDTEMTDNLNGVDSNGETIGSVEPVVETGVLGLGSVVILAMCLLAAFRRKET